MFKDYYLILGVSNDATPEEKVLLISTSMAIDNIIYPTLGNKKH